VRGSTRRRGRTWTAIWDAPVAEGGRRRQRSKGGFRTQRDAHRFLSTVVAEVASGVYIEPSRIPLGTYLREEWLPGIAATVRPATRAKYEQLVRTHVATRDLGAIPLNAVTGAHLNGFYAELEAAGLSASTRRLCHAVLHRALRDATRWGKLARNPAQLADPPTGKSRRASVWSSRELAALLEHVADDRLAAYWRLAAVTGARRGELLALTWRATDLEGQRISIERALTSTLTFAEPKTNRARRTISLDAETTTALRRHRDVQLLERDLAGEAYQDDDLVFCDELGHPIRPQRVTEAFARHVAAAKLPRINFHGLRHTCATLMLTKGTPVHVVSARLGHSSPAITLNVYAHLLPSSDAEAAEQVAAALAG
jgi:integrase